MKNNADVKVMLKEAGILFAITLLSGLVLGFVYELTKEPRRIQQEKAVQKACVAAFPGAEEAGVQFEALQYVPPVSLSEELAENGVEIGQVYGAVTADGTVRGCVVQAGSSEGYGGNIVLYVGVAADGTVNGVSILELSETPGLGMEAPDVLVPQFAGRQAESFTYTKTGSQSDSEVDAISGATITTRAVVNAVNGALKAAQDFMQGGGADE